MLRTFASPLPSSATKQILVPSGDGLGYSSSTSVVLRQVDGVGAVGVAEVKLPVAVTVGFVDDLVPVVLELGQQVAGAFRRLVAASAPRAGNRGVPLRPSPRGPIAIP